MFIVVEEAFDCWLSGKAGNTEDYGKWFYQTIESGNQIVNGREGEKWAEFDLKAMVRRGRNNPSIIMWSLGNEIFQQLIDWNVTAPRKMVSADTVKRFLNDFYQTTSGTDYCSIRLFCFKKNRYGSLVPDHDLENVTLATYVAACLELNPSMNVRDGRGLKSNSVVHFHTA